MHVLASSILELSVLLALIGPAATARGQQCEWSALGVGMNNSVRALAIFDDGTGNALHAGGTFSTAGGVEARFIAKWDGNQWSSVGAGLNGSSRALTVFDDGGGPALFAGGTFAVAGSVRASRIAKWDGTQWSALGSEVDGTMRQ